MASARLQISLLLNGNEFIIDNIINAYNSSSIITSRTSGDIDQATNNFINDFLSNVDLLQSEKIQLVKLLDENYNDITEGGVPRGNREITERFPRMITMESGVDLTSELAPSDLVALTPFPPQPPTPEDEIIDNNQINSSSFNVIGKFRMKDEQGDNVLYNAGDVVYYEGNSYVSQTNMGGWVPESRHPGNPWKKVDLPDSNIDGAEF
tara:strand:- start:5857 stop:6480 length:624 start_codon:yes stop_codon:yes gene_type:complete